MAQLNISSELQGLVDYIMDSITQHLRTTALPAAEQKTKIKEIGSFLQRLASDPANKLNDVYIEKVSQQLLCSIGIDLKSNTVPIDKYYEILSAIDHSDSTREARHLFYEIAVKKHFTHAHKTIVENFKIIVCPVKDWAYYIDPKRLGLFGSDQKLFAKNLVVSAIRKYSKDLHLKNNILYKGSTANYFWLCTEDEFHYITNNCNHHPTVVNNVVDSLGLSHFNPFDEDWIKEFFYIELHSTKIESFKPNATIINWGDRLSGFMSRDGTFGETISISGKIIPGMKEKVFNKHILTDEEVNNSMIKMLPDAVEPPIDVNCASLITEGILRFKNTP